MKNGFQGMRVLSFESRRSQEVEGLIQKYGGIPFSAPSMVEIPLEKNAAVFQFAEKLSRGEIDLLVLTTGVGTNVLIEALQTQYTVEEVRNFFQKITLVARGPKPLAPLSKLRLKPHIAVPEPNTWHEIVAALGNQDLIRNRRIAIQEYGVSNEELIEALQEKGGKVFSVPVYRWALPDNLAPLQTAVRAIAGDAADILLFMSSQQLEHLLQVARKMGMENPLREGFQRTVIASIGPLTSETLERNGVAVDFEPTKSKMAVMIQELAQSARDLVQQKRKV